jgi:preprotein translocase subunit YajC
VILAQATTEPSAIANFLPLAVLALLFYFFMIRPQRRRTAAAKAVRDSVSVGSEIRTIGGIHGVVTEVEDDSVVFATEDGGSLRIERRAVGKVIPVSDQDDA